MDFLAVKGFISRAIAMKAPPAIKNLLPLLALLWLGGCGTPPAGVPAGPPGAVATLKGDPADKVQDYMGDEIHCRMQSIDGDSVGDSYQLRLGRHTLIATLGSQGKEYVGVIQLLIPEAKTYRLYARRKDDAVTVTLVDEEATKIVATSTAPLGQQMKFHVFVVQR